MSASLAGRIVLVTGASRGIGAATALACAAQGAHLVLLARTRGGLEELDDRIQAAGGAATLVPMDLTQGDRIDALGASLFQRFGRLDGWVSCAADPGLLTPVSHLDPPVLGRVLAVNLIANQRLMRSLEPLLRAAPAGRAVLLTDGTGRDSAFFSAYASSKRALEALVRAWAAELRRTPIRINLVDPGPTATRLRAHLFPGEDRARLAAPEAAAASVLPLLTADCIRHGELVQGGAQSSA